MTHPVFNAFSAPEGRRRAKVRRIRPYAWLGAGVLTVGVGAAITGGSAVAQADTVEGAGASSSVGSRPAAQSVARGPARPGSGGARQARRVAAVSGSKTVGAQSLKLLPTLAAPKVPANSPVPNQLLRAASTTASAVGSAQVWTGKGITVNSEVGIINGVIMGAFAATSSRADAVLAYSALGGTNGGKFQIGSVPGIAQSFTVLPYATWLDPAGTKGIEQINVGIREYTFVDSLIAGIPLLGTVGLQAVNLLQDVPLIGDLLAPIIGASVVAKIDVDVAGLAPGATPLAYTYKVPSFDGVKISTNFFPASGLAAGQTAPTTIVAPGFGGPGVTNPFSVYALKNEVPGIKTLRDTGYDVVTFDPRGEFDSGGVMHMADPNYEGKDTSAIVSWIAAVTPAALNAPGDPKVGMVGGSYGGALQLASAADPRIDALVPVDSWSTLLDTFYPNNTFKTAYGALYMINLLLSGVRVDPQLYVAVATGLGLNWLGPWSQDFMNASNPPLDSLTAPTLLVRGTQDVLVPLNQGTDIAETVLGNDPGTILKTFWFTGGHGASGLVPTEQSDQLNADTLRWLETYVKGAGTAAESIPNFQWYDQNGAYSSSSQQAFQGGFNDLPAVTATSAGGLLGIIPIFGGSGPGEGGVLINNVNGSPASNAVNVNIPPGTLAVGTQVVGSPTVSFTYQGLGIGKAVFAQVVDKTTGTVLGNVVTPIPVVLDGRSRTVTVSLSDISYTVNPGDALEIQITSSATPFENASIGLVNISSVTVTLPNRTVPVGP